MVKNTFGIKTLISLHAQEGKFEELVELEPNMLFANNEKKFIIVSDRSEGIHHSIIYAAHIVLAQIGDGFGILKRGTTADLAETASKILNIELEFIERWNPDKDSKEFHQHALLPKSEEDRMYLKLGGLLV